MKMRALGRIALASILALSACSADKSIVADKAARIEVTVTQQSVPDSRDARLPIRFDVTKPVEFTLDLRVLNLDGSERASFDGHDAWVRLTVAPGTIVGTEGPGGPSDPDVAGPNVHMHAGVARGIRIKVIGAYGDTNIIAQDAGYPPAPDGVVAQCADGIDNDGNGFTDYPTDPNCVFLNDDSESTPTNVYGASRPIYYAFPRIHDVQGPGTTPFNGKQVEIPGQDPIHMVVTTIAKDGMYITDLEDDLGAHTPTFNSVFVYNFNPPPEIHVCDRITRINGNVSIFVGSIQLGTAAWSKDPWLNDSLSGPCLVPDYFEVTDAIAGLNTEMQKLQARLIVVKNPTLGVKFGPKVAPKGTPDVGASNCDLNGDGIAGCIASKPGFRGDENACCQACYADVDCTEWNDYTAHAQVKIKFGAADALMFAKFSQVTNFNPRDYVGPGVFKEIRGAMSTFTGSSALPPYAINPRCRDDVVLATDDPSQTKDAQHACICTRTDPYSECVY